MDRIHTAEVKTLVHWDGEECTSPIYLFQHNLLVPAQLQTYVQLPRLTITTADVVLHSTQAYSTYVLAAISYCVIHSPPPPSSILLSLLQRYPRVLPHPGYVQHSSATGGGGDGRRHRGEVEECVHPGQGGGQEPHLCQEKVHSGMTVGGVGTLML